MTCPHGLDVGAYVVDALEPDERERLTAHLPTCDVCTAELRDLERLPGLLATVPAPALTEPPPVPSELAFRRLHRSATGAGPAHHRRAPDPRRRWLLVAAAVVVLGSAGAVGVVATSGGEEPSTVSASSGSLHVQASITPVPSGSRIALSLDGVPSGQQCELTVQAGDGHWERASTWTVDYAGTATVTGTVHIHRDDLKELVVRTLDGRTLISLPG